MDRAGKRWGECDADLEVRAGCETYNEKNTDITWEKCTLRRWLNGEFYNAAFTQEEQPKLMKTTVSADKNHKYSTNPGKTTEDHVWLLSIPEAEKYFTNDETRVCYPTEQAKKNGAYTNNSGASWWWLRSPGYTAYCAAYVDCDGSVHCYGDSVSRGDETVRPVVRLGL